MLPWLILLALLAIALCPTTPLSAVVAGFSAVSIAAYLPVPADCDLAPTLPGLSGDTARTGRDGLRQDLDRGDYAELVGGSGHRDFAGSVPDSRGRERGLIV